jgi:tRNA-dihydrouridine synthase 3
VSLKSVQYPKPITEAYLAELKQAGGGNDEKDDDTQPIQHKPEDHEVTAEPEDGANAEVGDNHQNDLPDVPIRFKEKKRLHWTGKTCT